MTDITLLDGGMGQELTKRVDTPPTPLWATQVMIDRPGLVQQIHAEYFAAGATVATTNTYAIHRDRLVKAGLEDRFKALHAAALTEAKAARDAHGAGRIAGAIGPLVGSYRPDAHPAPDIATPLYAEVATLLAPACDILIFETVASCDQARAVLDAAFRPERPVWLALTVDDEDGTRLRSGEPLAEVLPIAQDRASALLVNCSAPEAIPPALDILARAGLPFGAYANAFTRITKDFLKDNSTVAALTARRDLGPDAYADHAMTWVAQGATIVGGCCETGPAHIAEIARRLTDAGHRIV
ncbi:homocysteine S-methyltransferase family protein [Aestuariicoccus sp. MJ-SS9]|uniref:homocysteine S-methyltransferase family protein n=1 Tax=Aestuariicoccus sp. MJ-SS9 TaxID=3079855 RepID=UPI00291547D1|nr:homocysteine S-methyltransferase family protein [Aestuariicoccus sp. MJ-SS9]MDU8911739.1 homocysteine S-methyltransferase family protein [Aestuariicoccus sp. MJ-SS9]